jgi:hypothetical protein
VKARSILSSSIWRGAYTVARRPAPYVTLPVALRSRIEINTKREPMPLFGGVPYVDVTGGIAHYRMAQMMRADAQRTKMLARLAKRKAKPLPDHTDLSPPKAKYPRLSRVFIEANPGELHESALRAARIVGVDPYVAFAKNAKGNLSRYPENLSDRLKVYLHMRIAMHMTYPNIARACGLSSHGIVVASLNRAIQEGRIGKADAAALRKVADDGRVHALAEGPA